MIKKISKILLNISLVLLPILSFAQGTTGFTIPIKIINPLNSSVGGTLLELLSTILEKIIMPIAAIFVVVWIIYAGFSYVTANGNPQKIKAAHQRFIWALVGAVILLGAAGISKVVENTVSGLINP